ncbi:MAG: diguanylate cyclase [Ilumatobacteraceae bacterium]
MSQHLDMVALANDPELFRQVFAGLGHGIVLMSMDGFIIDVNDAHLDQVGRQREEMVGRFSPVYTHPDDLERLFSLMVDLIGRQRDEVHTSYRFIHGDGGTRLTTITARLIDVGGGEPIVAIASARDDDDGEVRLEEENFDEAPLSLFFGHATYALHRRDGTISRAGSGMARLLGRSVGELAGLHWSDASLGATLPGGRPLTPDRDPVQEAARSGTAELETVRLSRPDGSHVWVSIRATLTPFRGGKAVVSALTDVTELVLALEERTRLASIVDVTSDVIGSFDLDGTCRWLNASGQRILGVDAAGFDLHRALGAAAGQFDELIAPAVLATGRWAGDLVLCTFADGPDVVDEIHLVANVIADRDGDGATTGWTIVGHDFTEHREMQATLAHKATHDTLTGLPNRALLTERMADQARQGIATTVVFIDLDGFKQLNDTFGHEFGDDALVDVARRIEAAVSSGGFAARFGGDEFVVLPDPTWRNPLAELERRIFVEPFTVGPIILDITGRMGMATAEPGESGIALIARADREMYRAKFSRRVND